MRSAGAEIAAIPVVDVGDGGPICHAAQRRARAKALADACLGSLPRAARAFVPALDEVARRWVTRSASPFVAEIAQIAEILGFPGVWLLNGTYNWGCTAIAREEDGAPWLARTLDWPFAGLGRHAEVVRAHGPAGDYFNVTWPGYAGVLTAMAPRRFAACINQAPMRRRSRHPRLRTYDLIANALNTLANIRFMPPDQLLRLVFETCETFSAARRALENIAVARPVIFVLVGCGPGERCVIERTEGDFRTRESETSAANDWVPSRPMWEARIAADRYLICSSTEATDRCSARRDALARWDGPLSQSGFDWLNPPVLNRYTRLAITMNPSSAILRVAGYETSRSDLPVQVTNLSDLSELVGPNVLPSRT